ncbi:MAG: YfcE family phosphodiesterase [Bacteroidetes bacterium 4572_117]|nr:MAG: YfcE family phosphodiesterase [Bacteroidetes bacterium 4572_117]
MKKIGLLSDTHSHIDDKILGFFKDVDEIWHVGDIGSWDVVDKLRAIKPLKAVYGNIDGLEFRQEFEAALVFKCENVNVAMVHIGGYPGRYEKGIKQILKENKINLFISGHSHILKVIYDKKLDLLHINPGAAGKSGFHKVRTAIRFSIDKDKISNLEILELQR